jgi:hypothetical protein
VSAGEVAAVVIAVCAVVGVGLLAYGVVALTRTLEEVRETTATLRSTAMPVLDDAARAVAGANAELVRVDALVDNATSISGTVDALSHLFYLAFSNPIIKLMAIGTGTARAARALRERS